VAVGGDLDLVRLGLLGHRDGQPQHAGVVLGLVATGLNLAGVAMVLGLQDTNARLRADLEATGRRPATRRSAPEPTQT